MSYPDWFRELMTPYLWSEYFDNPPPVNTKKDFVRRYAQGEFGNCSPTWNNYGSFELSNYVGLVHLRNRIAGGPTWYNIPHDQVGFKMYQVVGDGLISSDNLYFSGMAPTAKTLLQGEVKLHVSGELMLYYSRVAKPMRDALSPDTGKPEWASGVTAVQLLRKYLCDNSYEWLQVLLRRYPGHSVEFSAYGEKWGTLYPRFNTCFWEVRTY